MSGLKSRNSGKRHERKVAAWLSDLWPGIHRTAQTVQDKRATVPDLDGPGVPYWIEVGFRTGVPAHELAYMKYLQAQRDRERAKDCRPILVVAMKSRGENLACFMVGHNLVDGGSQYPIHYGSDRVCYVWSALASGGELDGNGFLVAVPLYDWCAWQRKLLNDKKLAEGKTSEAV